MSLRPSLHRGGIVPGPSAPNATAAPIYGSRGIIDAARALQFSFDPLRPLIGEPQVDHSERPHVQGVRT